MSLGTGLGRLCPQFRFVPSKTTPDYDPKVLDPEPKTHIPKNPIANNKLRPQDKRAGDKSKTSVNSAEQWWIVYVNNYGDDILERYYW